MPDVHIRRTAAADLPALTRLWQTAFGDPPELIGAFYDRFPPETSTWVVEADGNVATAAHLLDGRLHTSDGRTLPCAYVYAVSTDPAQQGQTVIDGTGNCNRRVDVKHNHTHGGRQLSRRHLPPCYRLDQMLLRTLRILGF